MTKKPAVPLERRQMEAALRLYQKCKGWQATDEALDSLARSFPDFDFKSTLLKAAAVNALYGTQVYAVAEVAEHLCSVLGNTTVPATPAIVEELAKVKFVRGAKHITRLPNEAVLRKVRPSCPVFLTDFHPFQGQLS